MPPARVLLAFTGDLATSAAIAWLRETTGAEVVTMTLDFGSGGTVDDIRERALAIGAVRAHALDVAGEFARTCVLPALQAGALPGAGPALRWPVIARHLVQVAGFEGADAVAHGSEGSGLEATIRALAPALEVLAPARAWDLPGPALAEYARLRSMPVPAADPPGPARPDRPIAAEPASVEVAFESGVPVRLNGVSMLLPEMLQSLETIGRAHGLDSAAQLLLHQAHRELQQVVVPDQLVPLLGDAAAIYVDLVRSGGWHSPIRDAVDAMVSRVQEHVTGEVRLRLVQGESQLVGCEPAGGSGPEKRSDPAGAKG